MFIQFAEGERFLTASADGTLKFWDSAKADLTRKYIPQFPRDDREATVILSDDETAVTVGTASSYVHFVDIVIVHPFSVSKIAAHNVLYCSTVHGV